MAGDGQPQSRTATGAGPVGLKETLEDTFEVVGRNTDPRIAHTKADELRFGLRRQCHLAAGRGELDGVMDQVDQHLFQARRIYRYFGHILGRVETQDQSGAFGLGAHALGGREQQGGRRHGFALQRHLSRFDA